MRKRHITLTVPDLNYARVRRFAQKWLLPNPGTLIVVLILLLTVPTLARPFQGPTAASISTIPYQGRLANAAGEPLTDMVNMEFRLYDVPTGGTPLWIETWAMENSVRVTDGLFSVMLGSLNTNLASVVQSHSTLYLGIAVGTDSEMIPRVQLGSVPFSIWSLTVADGSITSTKIADGAVGTSKLIDASVIREKIADNAIGSGQIADGAVTQIHGPSLLQGPGNNYRVETGVYHFGSGEGWREAVINFSRSFSSPPRVFITMYGIVAPIEVEMWGEAGVHSVSTTRFTLKAYAKTANYGGAFYWMAIGN